MPLPPKDSLKRSLLVPDPAPASPRRNVVVPGGRANPFRASIAGSSWVEVAGEALQSSLAQEELHSLVTSMTLDELLSWLRLIFGEDIPQRAFARLRAAVLDGSLPQPRLVIVRDAIDGHPAAYHGKSRSILLSHELVLRARSDNTEAWKLLVCLTEEFGHHVDQLLRTHYSSVGGDALLDEGARMAYSLIDFGYNRGQRHREFARHTTDAGSVTLEVEFGAMTAAVQSFVSAPEQWEDSRSKGLEYFGAGRGSGRAGSYGHESIEDSLSKAGFGDADRRAVYFGNWLRDHSQLIDPKIIRKKDQPVSKGLTRESVTRIVDVMAREKFGNTKRNNVPVFQVTPHRLGVYRNEEHIDNPNGITDQRSIDPAFRGACRAEEVAVNALQMKNFIRSKGFSGGQPPRTHRVKDGDSLDSIARANGLTWQELARYNFGTDVKDEVSRLLYSKEQECIAGEATTGTKIALILLEDQGYIELRDTLGGLLERLHELEKAYPVVATLSCETIGVVLRSMKGMLGGVVHSVGSIIDDAQTAFLNNPNSTDPTHSQLAKDHDDHPLHSLAANLAAGAVLDVGKTLQRAWLGNATADELVLTAAHYFLHPAQIDPKGYAGWMRDHVRLWIPGHKEAIARLGSKTWVAEWTKQSSQHLKKMMAQARQLMGGARP